MNKSMMTERIYMSRKETLMVSIIVPVYKVEKYLDRCVKSIVTQTYQNLEIILVDDGSPDRCPQMCDRWACLDERIQVIHQRNKGVSEARNIALDTCTGEYILFVDGDDWIAPELCEKVVEKMERTKADVVVFRYYRCLTGVDKIISERSWFGRSRLVTGKEAFAMLINGQLNYEMWTRMYRRYLFENVRFPVGRYYEDVSATNEIMQEINRIYLWDKVFYYYEKRRESTVGAGTQMTFKDLLENEIESRGFILQKYPELEEAHKRRLGRIAYNICNVAGWGEDTKKAASILRQQKICTAGKEANLFLKHEKVFWTFVNMRRWMKDTKIGKWIWKIKWTLAFEIKGRKIKGK